MLISLCCHGYLHNKQINIDWIKTDAIAISLFVFQLMATWQYDCTFLCLLISCSSISCFTHYETVQHQSNKRRMMQPFIPTCLRLPNFKPFVYSHMNNRQFLLHASWTFHHDMDEQGVNEQELGKPLNASHKNAWYTGGFNRRFSLRKMLCIFALRKILL